MVHVANFFVSETHCCLDKVDNNLAIFPVFIKSYEPRCEKTGLRGFRPGPTQTGLYNH